MKQFELTFKPYGVAALLIEWPARLDETILNDILSLQSSIEKEKIIGIKETVNAYHSLTVLFDPNKVTAQALQKIIESLYGGHTALSPTQKKIWRVPVCYDPSFGIDLEELCTSKSISIEELIGLHSEPAYLTYFIGFLPGFLYLGGLPEMLHTPRRSSPRLKIARGAVAIGGIQTGIYPSESPGGWNIIGNSPVDFFNPNVTPPCFASAGDKIQFFPVSLDEHKEIRALVLKGEYKLGAHDRIN